MTGWMFSSEVIAKARRYLAEKRVTRDEDVPSVYWVVGTGRKRYRVQTDADPVAQTATWINCTCPHGMNAGAGAAKCSHAVAVLIAVRENRALLTVVRSNPTNQ